MLEVLTPNHLAYTVTVVVGSLDVSRNSQPSEVTTHAESLGAQSVTVAVESPDVSRDSRQSDVPTQVGSPDTWVFAGRLSMPVGSLDICQNSRQSWPAPSMGLLCHHT